MSIMLKVKEEVIELPPNFLEEGNTSLFEALVKQEFPSQAEFICSCGDKLAIGPAINPNIDIAAEILAAWYMEHEEHQSN